MKTAGLSLLITVCIIIFFGCAGKRPTDIGLKDGKLTPCPKKPNCVVSQTQDKKHYTEPIAYSCTKGEAIEKIKAIIKAQKRIKIIEQKENYLRVEFTTALMRYVDDVEVYFPDEKVIHVRSASRLGYHDMGLNRRRIEKIRQAFNGK
jgi:uncharacterized protein (DUF1499 family)